MARDERCRGATVQWIGDDLSGRDLSNVVLVEATLLDSNFSDCIMQRADLSRAMAEARDSTAPGWWAQPS